MFYDFDRINRDANGWPTCKADLYSGWYSQFVDVRDIAKHEKRHRAEPVEDDSLYDKLDLSEVL